jgi:L-rhamnose isomerase
MSVKSGPAFSAFESRQKSRGIDLNAAWNAIETLAIETPSWGYGDSGTRFRVFKKAGVPRNPYEKFDDAALVHKLTGIAPSVAIHIPWDKVDDFAKLKKHAEDQGVRIGAINPNVFQDDDYMLGSVCNSRPEVRKRALDHILECVDVMNATGSDILSLWYADGTNYPGQADIRERKHWMEEAHSKVYAKLGAAHRMLIEYKFFIVGSVNPYELFLIFFQILAARRDKTNAGVKATADNIAYMIDQSHNIEPKIPAMIRSVLNCQTQFVKALLINWDELSAAQKAQDVLGAETAVRDAFEQDVTPLLEAWRDEKGLHANPMKAFVESGYGAKVAAERGTGGASW